jgi:hypothetical protein
MPYEATVHNVFIASPSDVLAERTIVRDVIYEWNAVHAEDERAILQPIGWETHSFPDMGDRAQGIINRQILEKSDILVAIFWYRLGTATGVAESGTIEEIENHLKSGRPAMIYFSSKDVPRNIDTDQLEAIRRAEKNYQSRGLIDTFENPEVFKQKFTRHLASRMVEYLKSQPSQGRFESDLTSSQPDLRFVVVQHHSMVGVMRRRDERQNAQILTKWNVTNASASGLPVRLLRARLVKPQILDSSTSDVVLMDDATGDLYSQTNAISPGETRIVSISFFCALPLQILHGQIELQIVAVDQLAREHVMPSITLPVIDPLKENLTRVGESSHLKWSVYKYGYLLKCSHGYYFVYLAFDEEEGADRWFTEYESGAVLFGENGILTGKVHGFHTFEEAHAYCEKDAEDVEKML